MKRMPYLWYGIAFVVACGIGLAAAYTESGAHGTAHKSALAAIWITAVVVWTTIVFFVPGWLERRRG